MSTRFALVTGATGNQGRAVTEALLRKGHRVRALTRGSDTQAAKPLKERGAEVVVGDNDDRESLEQAMSGVDAVFAMTTPAAGVDVEVRHGKAIADAAKAAGVRHLVYSSAANADQQTGIPHFDSKYEVEQHIRKLDVPWTIVAPAFFMNNVLFPWNLSDLRRGQLRQALPPGRKLQQISPQDIGSFSSLVIERRDPFIGRRIDIGADELTGPEMAAALSKAIGRPIEYDEQSLEEVSSQFADMAIMYDWLDRVGFSVDLDGLRRDYPEVGWTTFEQWASAQDWGSVLEG